MLICSTDLHLSYPCLQCQIKYSEYCSNPLVLLAIQADNPQIYQPWRSTSTAKICRLISTGGVALNFPEDMDKLNTGQLDNIFISYFIVHTSLVEDFIGYFSQFLVPGIFFPKLNIGSTLMGQISRLKSTFSFAENLLRIMSNYLSCEVNDKWDKLLIFRLNSVKMMHWI